MAELKKMPRVGDIMIREFTTIPHDAPIKEAMRILYSGGFSGTAVTDGDNNLVGVISEKDIFRELFPGYYEYMNREDIMPMENEESSGILEIKRLATLKTARDIAKMPITTTPDTAVIKIGAMMLLSHGIHRLPVLENGKVVGIVNRRAVYRAIFDYIFDFSHDDQKKS